MGWVPARHAFAFSAATTVVLCTGGQARADAPLQLEWIAPSGCPSASDVSLRVDRLAQTVAIGGPLVASGRVTQLPSGLWRLVLVTDHAGAHGTRELEAESCTAVAQAAALILALTLNPDADIAPEPPVPSPSSSPPSALPSASPSPSLSSAPPPATASIAVHPAIRWHALVEIGAALDDGTLPTLAPGARVGVGVTHGALQLRLALSAFVPQTVHLPVSSTEGGDLLFATSALTACYEGTFLGFNPAVCGGVELGVARGDGVGVTNPTTSFQPWVAGTLTAAVSHRIYGPLGLRLEAGGAAAIVRPSFYVDGTSTVYTAGNVALRADLALFVYF